MPKKAKQLEDFSGGVNTVIDPQNIADNELARCSGFKTESGSIIVLGDMKAAYTPSAAGEVINIEPGYGLFTFSHDYDRDGDLASTNYFALQNLNRINIYDDIDTAWYPRITGTTYAAVDSDPDTITDSANRFIVSGFEPGMTIDVDGSSASANNTRHRIEAVAAGTLTLSATSALTADGAGDTWTITGSQIDLGTTSSNAAISTVGGTKPCFFTADGALRVSPGIFGKVDSGEDTTAADTFTSWLSTIGGYSYIRYGTTGAAIYVEEGDLVEIDGGEYTVITRTINDSGHDFHLLQRNVTGLFNSTASSGAVVYVKLDAKWRGLCQRRAFSSITTYGTFSSWFTCPMSPRPPAPSNTNTDTQDKVNIPFQTYNTTASDLTGNSLVSGTMQIGYNKDEDTDLGGWGMTIRLWVSALYDDTEQESQPFDVGAADIDVSARKRLAITVQMQYADSAGEYRINKRVVGGRIYYENTQEEPGILYQLLEMNWERGCRPPGAQAYTPWVTLTANLDAICPSTAGATATNRTSTANAFLFHDPPRAYTYELNTGLLASTNIHARFKTAVVANRRTYVGNVAVGNKVYGDRILYSPVNKFDILPEINALPLAVGDGDEIVKLASFADRLLSFKKRTLYIINIGGGALSAFIESEHANKGVENPCQVCNTEYGPAWVNKFGVFLYDGQKIIELTRGKLQLSNSSRGLGLNVVESLSPLIGFHPLKKWLIVNIASDASGSYENEAWIHDFKNGSWTWSQEFTEAVDVMTNSINTNDNELVFAAGRSNATPDFFKYQNTGVNDPAEDKLFLRTKDFTLGMPSVTKVLHGVYITYSAGGTSQIEADIVYKTSTGETTIDLIESNGGTTYYTAALGFKTTSSKKTTIQLVPSSGAIRNANSFYLKLHNRDAAHDSSNTFKLYNITFIYRDRSVR